MPPPNLGTPYAGSSPHPHIWSHLAVSVSSPVYLPLCLRTRHSVSFTPCWLMTHDWLLSNAPPRLRAGALQQGQPRQEEWPGPSRRDFGLPESAVREFPPNTNPKSTSFFGTLMMCQMTYAYLGSKNIFTDDVGLYLRGNWKSQRKLFINGGVRFGIY